jgi:hypothetical protein
LAFLLALSLLIPWPVVLLAAVAHLQTITGNNSTGTTSDTSASLTASAGDLWIASECYFDTAAPSSVQLDGSTAFTQARSDLPGGSFRMAIYYLENVSSGSHTVTFNYPSSVAFKRWFVTRVSGAATSASLDGAGAHATGTSTSAASGTFTTIGTSFIYGLACTGGGFPLTWTAGSGWTEGTQGPGSFGGIAEYKANPGTTSHDATATLDSSQTWGASGVAFKIFTASASGGCRAALSLLGVGGC